METTDELVRSRYIRPFKVDERVRKFITKVDEENKNFYILPTTSMEVVEYLCENTYKGYRFRFDYKTYLEQDETVVIDHENSTILFKNDLHTLHYRSLTSPSLLEYDTYKKTIVGEVCGSYLENISNIVSIGILDLTYYSWEGFKLYIDNKQTQENLKNINKICITNSAENFQMRDIILEKYPLCKTKIYYR